MLGGTEEFTAENAEGAKGGGQPQGLPLRGDLDEGYEKALGNDVVGAAFEEGDDVGNRALVEEFDAFWGLVGEVGCEDYLITGQDGVVGWERFL